MKYLKEYNESSIGTKVLLITSRDDFGALSFDNKFAGISVADIIDSFEKGSPDYLSPDDEWNLEVFSFEKIDRKFAKFIKSRIQDYDDSKNTDFYLDSDVIR